MSQPDDPRDQSAQPDSPDAPSTDAPSTDRPSYEAARDELVEIVAKLESGQATLEESLELWERGEYLASIATEHLDGAQARLDAAAPGTDD